MPATVERLLGLTVGDVMTREVFPLLETLSMAEVAELLCDRNISGGPVVNAAGECIGVIASSDFVRRENEMRVSRNASAKEGESSGDITKTPVSAYMSSKLETISPEAPLMEAALQMSSKHIHRLPVVDAAGQPVGILTTTDLVAVIVNIVDEVRSQG